jgi:hypothetical protein
MPYVLTIATPATRTLVVEAMRARADTLARAATRASADLELERAAGKDVRSRAVKLVTMLAQARDLENLAGELEALEELALVEASAAGVTAVPIPEPVPLTVGADEPGAITAVEAAALLEERRLELVPPPADDDGLSAAAHALADAAGLEPTVLEDDLGALPEDEPTDVVDVLAAANEGVDA